MAQAATVPPARQAKGETLRCVECPVGCLEEEKGPKRRATKNVSLH